MCHAFLVSKLLIVFSVTYVATCSTLSKYFKLIVKFLCYQLDLWKDFTVCICFLFTRSYWPAVRYSYTGTNPWNSINLTVMASHNASVAGNMTLCPYYPEDVVYSASELTFETGSGLAWIAQSHQALYLSPWCIYSAQLTFSSEGMRGNTMDVDSLLFLPVPNNFTVFQLAGRGIF